MHAQLAYLLFAFRFATYRFLSGALVASRSRRRCRRSELMASRRSNLIHRRLLTVYAVDLLDDRIRCEKNFS